MAIDCLHEPTVIAFVKNFGTLAGVAGAALAWLLNNLLRANVWGFGETQREFDLIKGLKAEIGSNTESERNWSDAAEAEKLVARLKADVGPFKPWVPYVAVVDANSVFNNLKGSINRLPARAIGTVVEYYNLTAGMTAQLADLRSEAYANLSHERQVVVIRGIFTLGAAVAAAARHAAEALQERLMWLKLNFVLYGVLVVISALALLALLGAGALFVAQTVMPAAEWASACDVAPKSAYDHPQYIP